MDLMNYLIWHNTEKPHKGINRLSPLRYYLDTNDLESYESKMLWDSTKAEKVKIHMRH